MANEPEGASGDPHAEFRRLHAAYLAASQPYLAAAQRCLPLETIIAVYPEAEGLRLTTLSDNEDNIPMLCDHLAIAWKWIDVALAETSEVPDGR